MPAPMRSGRRRAPTSPRSPPGPVATPPFRASPLSGLTVWPGEGGGVAFTLAEISPRSPTSATPVVSTPATSAARVRRLTARLPRASLPRIRSASRRSRVVRTSGCPAPPAVNVPLRRSPTTVPRSRVLICSRTTRAVSAGALAASSVTRVDVAASLKERPDATSSATLPSHWRSMTTRPSPSSSASISMDALELATKNCTLRTARSSSRQVSPSRTRTRSRR